MFRPAFLPFPDIYVDYYSSNKPHNMQVLQYHDGYEIYLITGGFRYCFCNGHVHKVFEKDLVILKPFEMHYSQSLDSDFYSRYVLNVTEDQMRAILSDDEVRQLFNLLPAGVFHLSDELYEKVIPMFESLWDLCKQSGFLNTKQRVSLTLLLVMTLREELSKEENLISSSTWEIQNKNILQATIYIQEHYMEDLTLDSVASHVHLSRYYFCRQFASETGSSFLDYLTTVRLSKAHQLINEGVLSIEEIAIKTGFEHKAKLVRSFKKAYGCTPKQFSNPEKNNKTE